MLGEDRFAIKRPQIRRLKCEDPRIVANYNHHFEKHGQKNKIYGKYRRLQGQFGIQLTSTSEPELIQLDSSVTEASLFAERKCRKL